MGPSMTVMQMGESSGQQSEYSKIWKVPQNIETLPPYGDD